MLKPLSSLTLAVELSKVDEERRYVGGFASVEVLDKKHGIVDFDTSGMG